MGARGPIPFPAPKKARTGTLRKDREPENIAVIPPAIPKRPEHLTEAARAIYDDLSVTLCEAGLLTKADVLAFIRLCSYSAILTQLLSALTTENLTVQSAHGESISGELKAVMVFEDKVRNLEDRFGLNPAARSRIAVPKAEQHGAKEAADFA